MKLLKCASTQEAPIIALVVKVMCQMLTAFSVLVRLNFVLLCYDVAVIIFELVISKLTLCIFSPQYYIIVAK